MKVNPDLIQFDRNRISEAMINGWRCGESRPVKLRWRNMTSIIRWLPQEWKIFLTVTRAAPQCGALMERQRRRKLSYRSFTFHNFINSRSLKSKSLSLLKHQPRRLQMHSGSRFRQLLLRNALTCWRASESFNFSRFSSVPPSTHMNFLPLPS